MSRKRYPVHARCIKTPSIPAQAWPHYTEDLQICPIIWPQTTSADIHSISLQLDTPAGNPFRLPGCHPLHTQVVTFLRLEGGIHSGPTWALTCP